MCGVYATHALASYTLDVIRASGRSGERKRSAGAKSGGRIVEADDRIGNPFVVEQFSHCCLILGSPVEQDACRVWRLMARQGPGPL